METVPAIAAADRKHVERLLKKLPRKWRFTVDQIECQGSGDTLRAVKQSGKGWAVVDSTEVFALVFELELEFDDVVRLEKLELLSLDNVFNFTAGRNYVAAEHFFRNQNIPGVFFERVYRLSTSRHQLDLVVDLYRNGLFGSRRHFKMVKY